MLLTNPSNLLWRRPPPCYPASGDNLQPTEPYTDTDARLQDNHEAPAFDPTTAKKKKSRKSVAFAGEDGEASVENGEDDKTTADSHTLGTASITLPRHLSTTHR